LCKKIGHQYLVMLLDRMMRLACGDEIGRYQARALVQ